VLTIMRGGTQLLELCDPIGERQRGKIRQRHARGLRQRRWNRNARKWWAEIDARTNFGVARQLNRHAYYAVYLE
jgi:hypothetical protein